MAGTTVPARESGVVTRAVAGETVLVPVRERVADLDYVYTLDAVATFVWERIDGKTSVDALLGAILEGFDVDEPTAVADLGELLADLREAGLVRWD